jgi:hypothetical protein
MSISRSVTVPSSGAVTRLKLSIRFQPVDIALAGVDIGLGSTLPDLDHCVRRLELCLGGGQLGIEIWRVDLSEELPRFHVRTVIEIPILQVAVDSGIDRRLVVGLNVAGQDQLEACDATVRHDDEHGRERCCFRPLFDVCMLLLSPQDTDGGNRDGDNQGGDGQPNAMRAAAATVRRSLADCSGSPTSR